MIPPYESWAAAADIRGCWDAVPWINTMMMMMAAAAVGLMKHQSPPAGVITSLWIKFTHPPPAMILCDDHDVCKKRLWWQESKRKDQSLRMLEAAPAFVTPEKLIGEPHVAAHGADRSSLKIHHGRNLENNSRTSSYPNDKHPLLPLK